MAAMAVSEDGLTEAVCLPDERFVWAVQWHPEFSFRVNENSRKIFKAFIESC
ncbi:gamma-glutamyl-gamma-aminobutyrate hydrolase family protein [uncultured Gemmiger sp.]|uniref:gamma-glutamyl-gamma-aminobutyrate hydrolase family protein n=1 Tax=uncultured Gemmiger sp. TaxID=1623490 RepID=UPI0025999228|nr:gamma-glutamyl-gamma-aminobutyrate hydrolase family protein [uncultured Gemmiger sp.]